MKTDCPHFLKIFITHGHDLDAKDEVFSWLERHPELAVEPIDLQRSVHSGDATFDALERLAGDCDAAVILATPDDSGRLVGSIKEGLRARQNVWIELGWFWARLGRHRTLLLIKGELEIPSNYDGIVYAKYETKLAEASQNLEEFFHSLRSLAPDHLTEIVYLSSDPAARDKQWLEIQSLATEKLIVTGISMGSRRDTLPSLLSSLRERPNLAVDFVVVHPQYTRENQDLFESQHRRNAVRDNHTFFEDLLGHLREYRDVASRVQVFLYRGLPPFAAVVADGPTWGSTMIAQPFVLKPPQHIANHPRFKLKRRSREGVYMTYWNSIEEMIKRSKKETIRGIRGLERVVQQVKSLNYQGGQDGR